MIDAALSLIAPHACVSCSRLGAVLCAGCRFDLVEGRLQTCIGCGEASLGGLCVGCRSDWPVSDAVVFGARSEALKTVIDEYKFSHKRAAANDLAHLLAGLLPYRSGAVIVPIPTIGHHIRERGYDHMALLARRAARLNHLRYAALLTRRTDSVQHGAGKRERLAQAEQAFMVAGPVSHNETYIILDDITTTGASLKAGARALQAAGACDVRVAALARQPLD